MFDISLAELMLIVVVALVFIGPKELPHVIRAIAKALRVLKGFSREVKKTFDDLAEEAGINDEIKMIKGDDGKWYESYAMPHPPEKPEEKLEKPAHE